MAQGWLKDAGRQAGMGLVVLGILAVTGCGKESPPDVVAASYPRLSSVPDRPRPMEATQREATMESLEEDRLRGEGLGKSVLENPQSPAGSGTRSPGKP